MASEKVIAQQLSELSVEEQSNITKIGNFLYKLVPLVLAAALGLWILINLNNGDNIKLGLISWFAIGLVYIFVARFLVKRKYPYYSDAKWVYIYKGSRLSAYRGSDSGARRVYNTVDDANRAKLGTYDLDD